QWLSILHPEDSPRNAPLGTEPVIRKRPRASAPVNASPQAGRTPSESRRPVRRKRYQTDEQLSQVIAGFYEAATDASLWPKALQDMIAFTGNSGTHLAFIDPDSGLIGPDVRVGMPAHMLDEYNGDRVRECPRLASARRQPVGSLCYDYQHIDERTID